MNIPRNDWFAKDFERLRDKWIAVYGYQTLCEDAGRAGVDAIEFPEVVEPKYRCRKCNAPMVERKGPFGEFLACPKGTKEDKHPTQKMPVDYHVQTSSSRIERFHPRYSQEPLLERIARELSSSSHAEDAQRQFDEHEEYVSEGGGDLSRNIDGSLRLMPSLGRIF